ncbi:MAG: hypothetical protein M1831_000901 [Alyxoria varia]|nr:MAG: hypothetical protein M1831_000901 [Alyxoria varia]
MPSDFRASKSFLQLVVCVAVFTDVLVYSLVVPVLPYALSERIGLEGQEVQTWNSILLAIYGASIAVGSGEVASRVELVKYGALTMMQSLLWLDWRLFTIGFAMLFDKVGQKNIGQAMGWTSMSLTLGMFIGPIIGGLIYQMAGYFAVYLPAFALILVEIALRTLVVEDRQRAQRLVAHGTIANGYGTILPNSGDSQLEEHRSDCTRCLLGNRCHDEVDDRDHLSNLQGKTTSASRFPVFTLLKSARLVVAMEGLLAVNSFSAAFESVIPVYCKELFGMKPAQAAVVFIAITIPMLFSPCVGTIVDRVGPKWPAGIAFGIGVPGFVLMRFVTHDNVEDIALLVFLLFWFGCAFSLAMPAMMSEVSMSVEEIEAQKPGIFGSGGAFSLAYGEFSSLSDLEQLDAKERAT